MLSVPAVILLINQVVTFVYIIYVLGVFQFEFNKPNILLPSYMRDTARAKRKELEAAT